jgi:uncharacterized membrane protein
MKEQRSDYVRFHALQSTLGYAFLLIFWLAVKIIPFLYFLKLAPGILSLGFVTFMMLKAYDGEEFQLPIIGKMAFRTIYETRDDILAEAEAEAEDETRERDRKIRG